MAWKLQAMGLPKTGEAIRWTGTLSSQALPHGVLACRAAVLNLLSRGMDQGVHSWDAVGAITYAPAKAQPIRVAYGAIEVPVVAPLLTDESVRKRSIFDLLMKMKDPGEAIAELEALAARSRLGADPITGLLRHSEDSPAPSIHDIIRRVV